MTDAFDPIVVKALRRLDALVARIPPGERCITALPWRRRCRAGAAVRSDRGGDRKLIPKRGPKAK